MKVSLYVPTPMPVVPSDPIQSEMNLKSYPRYAVHTVTLSLCHSPGAHKCGTCWYSQDSVQLTKMHFRISFLRTDGRKKSWKSRKSVARRESQTKLVSKGWKEADNLDTRGR